MGSRIVIGDIPTLFLLFPVKHEDVVLELLCW